MCGDCLPCHEGIDIGDELCSDDVYDQYRTMGRQAFAEFAWSQRLVARQLVRRRELIAQIESYHRCGVCEPKCPCGLPIVDMLATMLPGMRDMVTIYEQVSRQAQTTG